MADEHKTVALSIFASLATTAIIFLGTIVASGGFSQDMFFKYVFPMIMATLSLSVFFLIVFAKVKGKLPWLE